MKRVLTFALATAMTTVGFAQTQTTAARQQAPAKPEATMSKLLTSLQGVWVIVTANGQDAPAGAPEITLTITGEKYAQTVDGNVVERGTFKIDETKKPMSLDLSIVEGDSAGKHQVGIIEVVDAATIRGNLNTPGETVRPTNFNAAEGMFSFVCKKK